MPYRGAQSHGFILTTCCRTGSKITQAFLAIASGPFPQNQPLQTPKILFLFD